MSIIDFEQVSADGDFEKLPVLERSPNLNSSTNKHFFQTFQTGFLPVDQASCRYCYSRNDIENVHKHVSLKSCFRFCSCRPC